MRKLHTRVPGLVRGGGDEKINCDWIYLKYRESFFNPSEYLQLRGSGNIKKQAWRDPRERTEPIEKIIKNITALL